MRALFTGGLFSVGLIFVPLFIPTQEVQKTTVDVTDIHADFVGNLEDERKPCGSCHMDEAAFSGPGDVSIDLPNGISPGDRTSVTVAVSGLQEAGRQGFSMVAVDSRGEAVGTFDLTGTSGVRFSGDEEATRQVVTHSEVGTQQDSWTVTWIAPEDLSSAVTFQTTAVVANGDGSPEGDYVYTTAESVPLSTSTAVEKRESVDAALTLSPVYPNPVRSTARTTLTIGTPGLVTARLLDTRGRTVRVLSSGELPSGTHNFTIDSYDLASGSYVMVVETPGGMLHHVFTVL